MFRGLESVEKSHAGHERMARVRELAGVNNALVERADSQEKYCRIAAGDAELYLRLPRLNSTRPHSIWDHAPGAAIVEAAGGKVTDVDGSPLNYSQGKTLQNHGVIVSNGRIHDRIIEAVQQVLAAERDEHVAG
jgi:3'(2'), 5'-bisphosphate nucleotidase